MTEEVLHYIWANRLYSRLIFYENVAEKAIVEGEILQVGKHNIHAGPDFSEAKLCVGRLILAGNVEIHRKASEWLAHQHQKDPAYDNVILHVVLEADCDIFHRTTGKPLLTAEMICSPQTLQAVEEKVQGNTEQNQIERDLINEEPIAQNFPSVSVAEPLPSREQTSFSQQAPELFVERLQEKCQVLKAIYESNKGDLSETLYQLLLRHLGAKVNNDAFAQIALSLPLRIVRKHTDQIEALESLYLGQAALLAPEATDSYMKALQERYSFLSTKYGLTPIKEGCVRMLRLRPPAFPHRRLAIFASLRHHYPLLESLLLSTNDAKELQQKLSIPPSLYWQQHYSFSSSSQSSLQGLSKESIHVLLLNIVLPYRYFALREKARSPQALSSLLELASQLPAEDNRYTRRLRQEGIKMENALHSQAALQYWKHNEERREE